MLAMKPRSEITFRIMLTAVILFNSLAPNIIDGQAKQVSSTAVDSRHQKTKQDDDPRPIFERPKPKIGDRELS